MYSPETPRVGEADIIVAKNRSGAQGNVVLAWIGKQSTFKNAAHANDRGR